MLPAGYRALNQINRVWPTACQLAHLGAENTRVAYNLKRELEKSWGGIPLPLRLHFFKV